MLLSFDQFLVIPDQWKVDYKGLPIAIKKQNLDTEKNCCNYPKIGTVLFYYLYIYGSKRCKLNSKQCRPWLDCSSRSDLGLCTVCPDRSVRIWYCTDPKYLGRQVWANCRPRSDCSFRVYSVCHSVCIFWTHYCMVKQQIKFSDNFSSFFQSLIFFRIWT